MEGRRWPVVTVALIAINVLTFLGTHWTMDGRAVLPRVRKSVPISSLLLRTPERKMPDDVDQFISEIHMELSKQRCNPNRRSEHAWDARIRTIADRDGLQAEMDAPWAAPRRTGKELNYGLFQGIHGPSLT